MNYLTGHPVINGEIVWQYFPASTLDSDSGVRIGFHLSKQYSRREALRIIEDYAKRNKVRWISHIQESWMLDLDKLHEDIKNYKQLGWQRPVVRIDQEIRAEDIEAEDKEALKRLDWLKGKLIIEPDIETENREVFGKMQQETSVAFYIDPQVLETKRMSAMIKPLTDADIELSILRRYVKHHDATGTDAPKCARELDMREIISDITGRPADDVVVERWHARLAPASPYPAGVLRPCSDSTVNKGLHRFHARAYFATGKSPAWERIAELERVLPSQPSIEKEKEQKFGILSSLRQATIDFAEYASGLNSDTTLGVLFLDIDNFKALNTKFTESVVDKNILIPFQQLLSATCRHRGEAYRHGGEEFLLLLPNYTVNEVSQFAERLRILIETKKFMVGDSPVQVTVSLGIAFCPKHGKTIDALIEKANKAEHVAKTKGRNRVEVYFEDVA